MKVLISFSKTLENFDEIGESLITLLEDVVTTGKSSLLAVKELRRAGYIVNRVVAIIDREEGGELALSEEQLELVSLFKLSEISTKSVNIAKHEK